MKPDLSFLHVLGFWGFALFLFWIQFRIAGTIWILASVFATMIFSLTYATKMINID